MSGGFDLLGALSAGASPEEAAQERNAHKRTAPSPTTAARPGASGTSSGGSVRDEGAEDAPLPCSARGCSADAAFGLRWNNPRIHSPQRRKTWLACPTHREHLAAFLSDRGFLKETVDVAELPGLENHRPTTNSRGGDAE